MKHIRQFFYNVWAWLCTTFAYLRFFYKHHHDWDHDHLLHFIKFKLIRMERLFRGNEAYGANAEERADQMREVISKIDIILDGNFMEKEHAAHTKKWGSFCSDISDMFKRVNVHTEEDEEQEKKELWAILEKEEELTQQAYDDVFMQIAKQIRGWWD